MGDPKRRQLLELMEINEISDADLDWLAGTRSLADAAAGGRPVVALLVKALSEMAAALEDHGHILEDALPGRVEPGPHLQSIVVAVAYLRVFVPRWTWSVRAAAMWDAIGTDSLEGGRQVLRERLSEHPNVPGLGLDLASWLLADDGKPSRLEDALDALDLVLADGRLPLPAPDGPFNRTPPRRVGSAPTARHAAGEVKALAVAAHLGLENAGLRNDPRWAPAMDRFLGWDLAQLPWASNETRAFTAAVQRRVRAALHGNKPATTTPSPTPSLPANADGQRQRHPPTEAPATSDRSSALLAGLAVLLLLGGIGLAFSQSAPPPQRAVQAPASSTPAYSSPPPSTRPAVAEVRPTRNVVELARPDAAQPAAQPAPELAAPTPRYTVRLSQVDDHAVVLLGDRVLAQARTGIGPDGPRGGPGDSGRVDVSQALRSGTNVLTFRVTNDPGCCHASGTLEVFDGESIVAMVEHTERTDEPGVRYEETVNVKVP